MIIQTRYRDIDASEIECGVNYPEVWTRGKSVSIETPPVDGSKVLLRRNCKGPFYLVPGAKNPDGMSRIACIHMLEIGD